MSLATDNSSNIPGQAPAKSPLSEFVHDLSGSAITANGFAGELEIAREQVIELLKRLPTDTDPELKKELAFQLEDEMKHCLFRIQESLSHLDDTIGRLKAAK